MRNDLLGGIVSPNAPLPERMFWARMAAVVGAVHDGSTERLFQRIVAACSTFGVYGPDVDALAKKMGFWYHRPSDSYVSREEYYRLRLDDVQIGCRRLAH